MSNVQKFSVEGDTLVLTDLLENELRVKGRLVSADLVGGKVIIETENS
jgi:predicted RNA-binding protein